MTAGQRSVNLRYFALLREQRGMGEETITTTAATIGDLYQELAKRHSFTLPKDKMGAAVNDQFCKMDAVVNEGDQIVFIPPVAGG